MAAITDRATPGDDIVDIAERASLYAVLLSALAHQRRFQPLPRQFHQDLNIPPSEQPDITPRFR